MMTRIYILTFSFLVIINAYGSLKGSPHDFSGKGWSGGDLCITCHTPHNAKNGQIDAPLWNRNATTTNYTVYKSNTLKAQVGQPTSTTKLCLSCHDGSIAVDSFGNLAGGTKYQNDFNNGNLNSHSPLHPFSFIYDSALATAVGTIYDPTTKITELGGTIAQDLLMGPLKNRFECTSCHDIHNKYNRNKILKIPKTNSRLCLTCHQL